MCLPIRQPVLALLVASVVYCSCETFHIVPVDSTERCETEPCLTLDQLAAGELSDHNFSDLTLYFLPGKHILNRQLDIDCFTNKFTMVGYDIRKPEIWLQENKLIIPRNVQDIEIENLIFFSDSELESTGYVDIRPNGNVLIKRSAFQETQIIILYSINTTLSEITLNGSLVPDHYNHSALTVYTNNMYINKCEFLNNKCINCSYSQDLFNINVRDLLFIKNSTFVNNSGIIMIYLATTLFITSSEFIANLAKGFGGVIVISNGDTVSIVDTVFTDNRVHYARGVVVFGLSGNIEIINCTFTNNSAPSKGSGGAISVEHQVIQKQMTSIYIRNTIFLNNDDGTLVVHQRIVSIEDCSFIENLADRVLTATQSTLTLRRVTFYQNKGCIYTFNSKVDIAGRVTFRGNTGGAICAIQSQVYINSTEETVISNNIASLGGGILLRGSELVVRSPIMVSENTAQMYGGGIYAYQSVIDFTSDERKGESFIIGNLAKQNGGGICAVASTITITHSYVVIDSNTAQHSGGGIYLQENSKIYLQKQSHYRKPLIVSEVKLAIVNNFAKHGGGVFVVDNSTAGTLQCQGQNGLELQNDKSSVLPDCFIQIISYAMFSFEVHKRIFFINNTAELGTALYGGLLDRCTPSAFAASYYTGATGLQYIKDIVEFSVGSTITSDPVRVIICNKYNHVVFIKKGGTVKIAVSAVDQIGNSVPTIIHSSVVTESGVGRLKEGQAQQRVGNQCTELEYNVFSQDSSAQVELYADGPCTNLGISKQTVKVSFLPCTCPVGFQPSTSPIKCDCVCDKDLPPHHIVCFQEVGSIQLETNIWIGVVNSTNGTGYIIHDCPFDYCVEKPVNISLNSSQERDRQCAFNRSGVLCGECQQGLSLVLATSRCKKCSNVYLLLLLAFAVAGMALVAFILFFNVTMATGTIHSLIFYSNLLPSKYFTHPSSLTVFISWVNLDLGIETCFYDGMSSQAKVLLQLVFPAYLFLLIIFIIIFSRYSNFIATLLSTRNPVAALCTLIFLFYSKLLRFIIAALQSVVLNFPNGLKRRLWLYDANVQYFSSSHTCQFVAAVLILIVGGLFTLQLFFAQWFPGCSKWKLMKWTRNTKYIGSMDVFHAPFTRKHRYWVGLLLFALSVHNVVSAVATDDFLPVLFMGCIATDCYQVKEFTKTGKVCLFTE